MNKKVFKFLLAIFIFTLFSLNIVYGDNFDLEKNIIIYSLNNFFTDYYSCLTNLEIKDLSSYFSNTTSEEKSNYQLNYEALRLEINILKANNELSNTYTRSNYSFSNNIKNIQFDSNFATISLTQEVNVTDPLSLKINTIYKEFVIKLKKNYNQYQYVISTIDSNSYYVGLLKNITPKDGDYKESADLYFNETKNLMAKNNPSKKSEEGNPFSLKNILSKIFSN
ncbi:MAG: hypothetical protein FWC47_07565 [Oscillospiraceae bacterium]|nr:hypothetical protein [Oscillospiraceae bacterium]